MAQQAAQTALEHAMLCGDALTEAKTAVPHGEWAGWLESNTAVSVRSAQRYMKLANSGVELEAKNDTRVALSIRDAVKLLTKPREVSGNAFTPKEWRAMCHEDCHEYGLNDLSVEMRHIIVSWELEDHSVVQQLKYEHRMGACMMLQADGYDVLAIADYLGIETHEVSGAMGGAPLPFFYQGMQKRAIWHEKPLTNEEVDASVQNATRWNIAKGAVSAIAFARRDKRTHLYEVLDAEFNRLWGTQGVSA